MKRKLSPSEQIAANRRRLMAGGHHESMRMAGELLEALEDAVANLLAAAEFFPEDSHEHQELVRHAEMARAAIAKAKGQ